ncbi:unnamed protein product [Calypogeia fissa]
MDKEVIRLNNQLDEDQHKNKSLKETIDQLYKEKAKGEGIRQDLAKEILLERNIASKVALETKHLEAALEKEKKNGLI